MTFRNSSISTTAAITLVAASALSVLGATTALVATTSVVQAGKFSKGSKASEFGLSGEEKAKFSGKVVDILCELAGDCPADCGGGDRTLGVVRDADNALVIVSKNGQFEFNGPIYDLLPFCNKAVDVDGLLIGDDPGVKGKIFMVQRIRAKGKGKWKRARGWTKGWTKRNPDAKGKGPWYRRDPRILKQIKKDGYFGLGADVDAAWRKENQ